MSNLPIYEMLAHALAREGVDTLFNLMGDGNMHWATAMSISDQVASPTMRASRSKVMA
jgi:thiamine pyrophosphate-dependent acetolactate synthase large subunit-like protein